MKYVGVNFKDVTKKRLEKEAKDQQRSLAQQVRFIVKQWFECRDAKKDGQGSS